MNDVNSLSHSSWNCKYHVVFAPKYRRKVFFGEKRREIGSILRTPCNSQTALPVSVSYTHLDVYKRQAQGWCTGNIYAAGIEARRPRW